ncbi:hypothetical protein ACH0AH_10570 [Microbacterium paludicola]|uniref:Uncharacterized protein n=1 Tax=Microbacterium paludicola TaxID=300019 RepID=A0A4Y9FXG8_9MICO|nr:hypothetical protein [Microbacterium paludicola]MBF0815986.1 hypothetical protein [Microbacterium paludicola]TFU33309.1 hypothetical protein E4U02_06155 [Microbacterium paludicola]
MTRILPVAGALAVAAYALVGVLSIVVWDPMAAVPGASHAEVVAGVEGSGESWTTGVVIPLALFAPGVIVAAVLSAVAVAGRLRWSTAAAWQLGLLVCGAPVYFAASFPMGMAVADAFLVSGGSHQPAPLALYGVSALAALVLVIGGVVALRGRPSPEPVAA